MVIHPLVVNSFNKTLPRLKANAVELARLKPHSLCYTCWVRVCTHTCLSTLLFSRISSTAAQCPATWRTTSAASATSRCSSPSRRPCGALLFMYLFYTSAFLELILDSVVIKIYIYNLHAFIRDMCCDILVICCIYAWLDSGAYMIARFMFL
jgi:hypothetical protein